MRVAADESFRVYIRELQTGRDAGLTGRLLARVTTGLMLAASDLEIRDYLAFKVAKLRDGDRARYFVGAFHRWTPVEERDGHLFLREYLF